MCLWLRTERSSWQTSTARVVSKVPLCQLLYFIVVLGSDTYYVLCVCLSCNIDIVDSAKRKSFQGTVYFMAPEVIEQKGHDLYALSPLRSSLLFGVLRSFFLYFPLSKQQSRYLERWLHCD